MGSSPYGRLSFGVAFDESFEFPWSDRDKYDNDIRAWWKEINGYVKPCNLQGFDTIWEHQHRWLKLNPLPIELIERGYIDSPSYIIATKTMTVEWDETLEVNIDLFDDVEEQSKIILDFLNKYNIEHKHSPKWLLSSFYG